MSTTWSLPETDSRLIESILEELLGRTQALAAHLVDRSGRPVATVGDARGYDLTTFASLASADLAANDELARLLGEPHVDGVACLGSFRSMASSRIGDQLVLCVVFDGHSSLGLVRHRMKRATERLWALFQSLADRAEPRSRPPGHERYEHDAAAAVDDLLGGDGS